MNMARWFGMDQLVGELLRHWAHEIAMLSEKMNVLVIRGRLHGIDLDRIGSPVFKKQPQSGARKSSRSELFHKSAVRYSLFPSCSDLLVKLIDERFRFNAIHEYLRMILPRSNLNESKDISENLLQSRQPRMFLSWFDFAHHDPEPRR